MARSREEKRAVQLLIEALAALRSLRLSVTEEPAEFPDFVLLNAVSGERLWVEVVRAVESGSLLAASKRALRIYLAAKQEHQGRGEEVILEYSSDGIQSVTPSPGFGVTGFYLEGGVRQISPGEWITRCLNAKGRPARYGPREREKTLLLIDCSNELLVSREDVDAARDALSGQTLGFREVWVVSENWEEAKALLLGP